MSKLIVEAHMRKLTDLQHEREVLLRKIVLSNNTRDIETMEARLEVVRDKIDNMLIAALKELIK